MNSFNLKVVLHPNTSDKSSGSVNTRITYILHILILQRVFECTQSLCLRNSCFYALKDWIDVQNSYIAFEKKDKKSLFHVYWLRLDVKENQFLAENFPIIYVIYSGSSFMSCATLDIETQWLKDILPFAEKICFLSY